MKIHLRKSIKQVSKLLPSRSREKGKVMLSHMRILGIIFSHVAALDWIPAIVRYFKQKHMFVFPKNDETKSYELHDFLWTITTHRKEKVRKDFYRWEKGGKEIIGNLEHFFAAHHEYFQNLFDRIYEGDWKGKVILDLGGHMGDSALFFFSAGAKSLIVYEPVLNNIEALRLNLAPYKDRCSIFQRAVNDKGGPFTITSQFPPGSLGFGLEGSSHALSCEGTTFEEILSAHPADAVKVDIEGAERHLINVRSEILKKVPYWIVETHNHSIREKILEKFSQAGLKQTKHFPLSDLVDLYHFTA